MGGDNASGAQTERRGGAGPVRGLLGGKDPTGRFFSGVRKQESGVRGQQKPVEFLTPDSSYQSDPSLSFPAGVTAAHQVSPLRFGDRVRTLPSARQTDMPAL